MFFRLKSGQFIFGRAGWPQCQLIVGRYTDKSLLYNRVMFAPVGVSVDMIL